MAKNDYEASRWTTLQTTSGGGKEDAIEIIVDDRAATREAILNVLRAGGARVVTTSDWHPKKATKDIQDDWNYSAIVIHHAGNSYRCDADSLDQLRRAEMTDLGNFGQMSYHYAIDCAGVVYESLDIRVKGKHLANGNTGRIGIVLLADLSTSGEAMEHGPELATVMEVKPNLYRKLEAGILEVASLLKDAVDLTTDVVTDPQFRSALLLCETLSGYFHLGTLGGHREFAITKSDSRACPGERGLALARVLRQRTGLRAPSNA